MYIRGILVCADLQHTLSLTQPFSQFAVVTCGSVIKLQHVSTGYRLHSHEIKWGSGSSQQSVTAMNGMDDPNSLWEVKGAHGTHCAQGSPIKNGEVLNTSARYLIQAVGFSNFTTGCDCRLWNSATLLQAVGSTD